MKKLLVLLAALGGLLTGCIAYDEPYRDGPRQHDDRDHNRGHDHDDRYRGDNDRDHGRDSDRR